MKTRSFFVFLFLVACFSLFFSCTAEQMELINTLTKENYPAKIKTMEEQIASIDSSVVHLKEVDSGLQDYIKELQTQSQALSAADKKLSEDIASLKSELTGDLTTAQANVLAQLEAYKTEVNTKQTALEATIESLQSKDVDLQAQITALQQYVKDPDAATKEWVSATFVTQTEFNATADIVAGIQTQIATINASMASFNKDTMDEALSTLDESLQGKIAQAVTDCNTALATAKEQLTAAYTTAIQQAIASSESSMKTWVNQQLAGYYTIAQTDAKLSALKSNLEGQLASQKTYLEGLISSLETTLTRKIDANATLINGLQTQVNGLSSDLSALAGTVATNGRNISKNAADISTNAKAIAANASDIDACERLIAANQRLIEENAAAISTNATAIATLQSRATTDEQSIAKNVSDIAKNAQDIAANAALISANATAISNNAKAISDNAAAIVKLGNDLTTARTEITAAYQQAISTAISTLDGKLSGQLVTDVSTLNSRIDSEVSTLNTAMDALTARVTACEKDIKNIKSTIYSMQLDIEELQEQVAAILARIQSISYVPKYSDGKAVMTFTNNGTITPGTAEFNFELQPAATAAQLAQVWQSVLSMTAVYTVTKASPETVALSIESVTADNGFLTVVVSGSAMKNAYFLSQCSASVRLKVSDGNNERCSEYIEMVPWTTDVISFADANFKAYCVENFDTSGDGELTEEEAKAVTAISASMLNISSLVGIEYFSNLETIDVSYNKLESLDLTHSPKLKTIDVTGNKLQNLNLSGLAAVETLEASANKLGTLDVSDAVALKTLNANNNQLGALNISRNKALTELQCASNNIAALDFKNNTTLETIVCRRNSLSTLDVTKLAGLKVLDCGNNNLASLNVNQNPLLESLYCSSNGLTTLTVSANTALSELEFASNSLTNIDVTANTSLRSLNCSKNNLSSLNISRNAALEMLTCTGNAGLEKLWVKDAAQATAVDIRKDELTSIFYNNGGITIPDANLKAYLLALFDDDEDGEISILESENIQNVNCSNRSISDLTGLECCTNLKYLNFNGNNVSTVELPNLKKLETIVAYGNPISRLNVNNDTALTALYLQDVNTNALDGVAFSIIGYNQAPTLSLAFAGTQFTELTLRNSDVLTSYDVSENVQLTKLDVCNNPQVAEVNVSTLSELTYLNLGAKTAGGGSLASLNVENNLKLETLYCDHNVLTSLNVDNNVNLVTFNCSDNQLSTLRITNNTLLETVDVSNNQLLNLNVRQNTALKSLNVGGNTGITALALGYNTALETLNASNTGLTDIDLSANLAIKDLNLSGCSAMHIIDLSANTALTTLDVSNNTSLATLNYKEGLSIISGFSIGRYIVVNGVSGVTFYSDGKFTKIISVDETSKRWGYSGSFCGAVNSSDGKANTDKIASGSDAAIWCRNKGAAWYLPAQNELMTISNNRSILNTTLSSIGGTQLGTSFYWSSTEHDSTYAHIVSLVNGSSGTSEKNKSYTVRAVRIL